MKVAPDFARPVFASVYEVAGRFLLFDTSDAQTANAIRLFLDRWRATPASDEKRRTVDATLIFRTGQPPPIPPDFEQFALNDGAVGYTSHTAYQIVLDDSGVLADASSIVRVWAARPIASDQNLLSRLVSYSLPAALRRCGVFELHSGAAINELAGKTLLICGPSGSGKSTLTLQLAANGWSYVSDDVVLLSPESEKVKAFGLRKFFALTRQTMTYSGVPQVDALIDASSGDHGKRRLEPQQLFPSGLAEQCWPNVIVFPTITKRTVSTVRKLSPATTMSRLIRLCPWSCYDRAAAHQFLNILAKLVRQSTSYDLFAGSDLMGDPSYTSRFLASTFGAQAK